MPVTPIKTSLFNATLNAYVTKRPKVVNKIYSMREMFENISKLKFPIEIHTEKNASILKQLNITSILACLPGGRGCVGKERLGSKLTNRQIAVTNAKGKRYNPKFKNSAYGFIQLIGTLVFADGSTSNINIPIETSGIIGIRSGTTDFLKITPNNSQNKLMKLILEIEKILFKLTTIKKVREPRIEMINAYFNLYTDKTGKNRPKIENFKKFLRNVYKNGLQQYYSMARMPWLMTQGNPTVTKGVFKPKTNSGYSTITISPFGRVELLGVKSIDDLKRLYNLITNIYNKLSNDVKKTYTNVPNEPKTKRKYVKKPVVVPSVSMLNSFLLTKKDKKLFINKKPCATYKKPILVELAKRLQVSHRGTRTVICNNIYDSI
tara:strand:+ start:126 stop:1256 length:1131 start_codon:yes stop_codon:yes gene_type:complete